MDILGITKSKTRKKIFQFYFGKNEDGKFYLRELERILKVPVKLVREELMNLEKEGLFKKERVGNLVFYSLNKENIIFEELKSIINKTIGIDGLIKEELKNIGGIEVAFIYGSIAKEKDKAASDIDLILIVDKKTFDPDKLHAIIWDLEKKVYRDINYSYLTLDEWKKRIKEKNSFYEGVKKNKKIILIGNEKRL